MKKTLFFVLAGGAAGSVTGLFGAGGGMVLVPLLTIAPGLRKESVFPTSVAIILPAPPQPSSTTRPFSGTPPSRRADRKPSASVLSP